MSDAYPDPAHARLGHRPKFPFRVFRTDEIRERLSESRRIEPPLSRASSGSLLVK
jgi:hypothetical protein